MSNRFMVLVRAGSRVGGAMLGAAVLAGCVAAPPPRTVAVPTPQPAKLFVYPSRGQTPEQTDRDRYECHLWAVQQTGVDPSRPDASPYERVVVQPAPPSGAATAVGAIGGAILGSLIAGPRDAGAGLVLGGITGAVVGSASDANAQAQAAQGQAQVGQGIAAARARADTYRRALATCLTGRGYTVS